MWVRIGYESIERGVGPWRGYRFRCREAERLNALRAAPDAESLVACHHPSTLNPMHSAAAKAISQDHLGAIFPAGKRVHDPQRFAARARAIVPASGLPARKPAPPPWGQNRIWLRGIRKPLKWPASI